VTVANHDSLARQNMLHTSQDSHVSPEKTLLQTLKVAVCMGGCRGFVVRDVVSGSLIAKVGRMAVGRRS
jgi:hypothetical protein